MLSTLPLTGFALGRLAVVGDVAFQAAQRGMPAEAFEVNFGVIMGSAQTDGGVAQLVEIPVGGIAFPERVGLAVRETSVAIGGEISTPRQTGFAMRHEERSRSQISARRQVLAQEGPDGTREEHLAWAIAVATKTNRAIGPGNVLDVDSQGFLTAKATIIDQPEQGAIARILDFAQH